jgi:two-component system response regulator HydG
MGQNDSNILIVDDEPGMREFLEIMLQKDGYSVDTATDGSEAIDKIEGSLFDLAIVDIQMPVLNGIEVLKKFNEKSPDTTVIMITAYASHETAIEAMKLGAYDYITKPFKIDEIKLVIKKALEKKKLERENTRLRKELETQYGFGNIIGRSPSIVKVFELIKRVSELNVNVLITGESGTGKELVARALHERSGRRGPFLAINCAAVPENLLESELFGYTKGAFTDARTTRTGFFVEANQGTLFLDEIAEMPLGMQSKILRALQERSVRPLGSTQELPFDARIITATNKNLEQEVAEKRFRDDLYYRVNVVRIDVPPLRARGHDILVLAQHFLERAAARSNKPVTRIGRLVAEQLASYDWPGNVRELENCMERAVALARFDELTTEDLPAKVREFQSTEIAAVGDDPEQLPSMDLVEERYVRRVLAAVGGNKTLAARILGFDRRTLYRKLARYN